jgi:hypothetical protein
MRQVIAIITLIGDPLFLVIRPTLVKLIAKADLFGIAIYAIDVENRFVVIVKNCLSK